MGVKNGYLTSNVTVCKNQCNIYCIGWRISHQIFIKQEVFLKQRCPHHCKPCFGIHSSHLPMASFKKFFWFLIIYSKKGLSNHSLRLGTLCLHILDLHTKLTGLKRPRGDENGSVNRTGARDDEMPKAATKCNKAGVLWGKAFFSYLLHILWVTDIHVPNDWSKCAEQHVEKMCL